MAEEMIREAFKAGMTLEEYKEARYDEIDSKTASIIIEAGFTYDSIVFSTSRVAQFNWSNLKNSKSTFTFPKDISTKAHGTYSLAEANVDAFWLAGKNVVDPLIDAGRVLVQSITDAVDIAAVKLITDAR